MSKFLAPASSIVALALVLVLSGCGAQSRVLSHRPAAGPPGLGPRYFGFIPHVDASARTISFDRAEWLSGEAAQRAAEEDGAVAPGEPVSNDYYIRNQDKSTRILKVWSGASIMGAVPATALRVNGPPPWCTSNPCDSWGMDLDEFFAAWRGRGGGAHGSYWVTLWKGRVARIEEQYRP